MASSEMSIARHLGFVGFSGVLAIWMLQPIREVIAYSLDGANGASSQIVAVPFVTAFLIWLRRREIFLNVKSAVTPGAVVLGVGLLLLVLPRIWAIELPTPDDLSLAIGGILLTWLGGALVFYGSSAFRAALFPLLFLAFCIPIPTAALEATIEVFRRGSAELAYGMLRLSGTPVYREGYVFALPGLTIEIAPECSGIRSGIGMLMTGLIAGNLMLATWWRRAALIVTALPLLLLKNAIRIDTLSLLSIYVDPGIIEGRLHHEGGLVFFALGLLMLYPVLLLLMKSESSGGSRRSVSAAIV